MRKPDKEIFKYRNLICCGKGDFMRISEIKTILRQYIKKNSNVLSRGEKKRLLSNINKLGDVPAYRTALCEMENTIDIKDVYFVVKEVFLTRYSNDGYSEDIKSEMRWINQLTNILFYPGETDAIIKRHRWKLGTKYEEEYYKSIAERKGRKAVSPIIKIFKGLD